MNRVQGTKFDPFISNPIWSRHLATSLKVVDLARHASYHFREMNEKSLAKLMPLIVNQFVLNRVEISLNSRSLLVLFVFLYDNL